MVSNFGLLRKHPRVGPNSVKHSELVELPTSRRSEKNSFEEEYRLMKRYKLTIAALTLMLAVFAPLALAQTTGSQPATGTQQPAGAQPAAAQDPAAEEAAAYKAWYEANKAQDLPKALELAKTYLAKYPNGNPKNVTYLKQWIPATRGKLLQDAVQAKNIPNLLLYGKEAVAANPDNVDYPLFLVAQLRTLDTTGQYMTETMEFTQAALRLIESGKTPTPQKGTDGKEIPFDKNKTLAFLRDTAGAMDEKKNPEKSLEQYHQAAQLDPSNARYFFNCGRLHQTRYTSAATKFQAFSQEDRTAAEPKPEVKAVLDEINKEADAVINCWARFLGLEANNSTYKKDVIDTVNKGLTDLYKYRHNDSTEGLQKLIDDNKTSPTPVTMTPPAAAPAAASATAPAEQKAMDQNSMSAKPGAPQAKPSAAPAKPPVKRPR